MPVLRERATILAESFADLIESTDLRPLNLPGPSWLHRPLAGLAASFARRMPADLADDDGRAEELIAWLQAALRWITDETAPPPPPLRVGPPSGSGPRTG